MQPEPAAVSPLLSLAAAVVLALVHLFAGGLRFLDVVPRSRWLSAAGGVAVAYVFLHLLPEVASGREHLAGAVEAPAGVRESVPYLLALVGLAAFYGLERMAVESRRGRGAGGEGSGAERGIFWLHVGSFAVYNVLIGYLLARPRESGGRALLLFALAMALHFLVNDFGLRGHHRDRYVHAGRWLLAGAVVAGWGVAQLTTLGPAAIHGVTAFLAGGIVLNVLKEELPEERESRFGSFAVGAAVYAALLLAL